MCEDGAGKAAGPRFVRVRTPEGRFRGVDIGSVPPWRDGKREALAPIRQPPASSRAQTPSSRPMATTLVLVHRLANNGGVAGGQLAVFQGASEAPISYQWSQRATRKNSQLARPRVALKMGRRLRRSSVTYRFRYAPLAPVPARTALPTAHFERNDATHSAVFSPDGRRVLTASWTRTARLWWQTNRHRRPIETLSGDTPVGCHTWRATGITIYLENDGRLQHAQQMAGHESPQPPEVIYGQRTKLR